MIPGVNIDNSFRSEPGIKDVFYIVFIFDRFFIFTYIAGHLMLNLTS